MLASQIRFPFADAPDFGRITEIAEGVLWARLPLPFKLSHVNIYLVRDNDGWAVIDTGAQHPLCIEAWESLLAGPLAGFRISKVIVTHFHPDHVGLAGWLCERFDAELLTTHTCWEMTSSLLEKPTPAENWINFYVRGGMNPNLAQKIGSYATGYKNYVAPIPQCNSFIDDGTVFSIGGREFRGFLTDGHARDQLTLYCPEAEIYFSADQVIPRITPHVGIEPSRLQDDTLGAFLAALKRLAELFPTDTLAAPGHELPFYGLAVRCADLIQHHIERCDAIIADCSKGSRSVTELLPVLFKRELDEGSFSFAHSEARAHINYLVAQGSLQMAENRDNIDRWELSHR